MKANILILTIIVIGYIAPTAFADVKIKSRQTMAGQTYESTTYIKGKRQRSEQMNGMTVSLTQCDLHRGIQMNPQAKTYIVNPFATADPVVPQDATTTKSTSVTQGGKVTTTITTKDTGERKQMFGFPAKHLIITMETVSSPDSCNKTNSKMQTDGWYIDAEFVLDCDYGSQAYGSRNSVTGGCRDKYEMRTIGTAKRGYPVYEKMTMFDNAGTETYSMINEVIELSKAVLEASLFDVPQDYREVSDASQMYAGMSSHTSTSNSASSSAGIDSDRQASSGFSAAVRNAGSPSRKSDAPIGAKTEGIIRIGLANIKTGAVGNGINAGDLAAAIQNSLISYLKVPSIEVVTLDARLASVIDNEAAEKQCDYVLYPTVSHKKGGGGFGGLGGFASALGSSVGSVGIGHTGNVAGNLAGQIATQSIVAATVSSNVRSKDEITLDIKMTKAGGTSALERVFKTKARSDGDDIISQVVEQAAESIVNTILK